MKSSEEIVNKIINEQNKPKSLRIGRKGEVVRFSRMIESYADRMTTATLDTLKERVEEWYNDSEKLFRNADADLDFTKGYFNGETNAFANVLQLIDEARNE